MQPVILTALGVGGATVIGAIIGFMIKKPSHKLNDIILSFAAGVMLAASVIGLVLPSIEYGQIGKLSILVTIAGIFCGAFCLNLIDKLVPHLHKMTGVDVEAHPEKGESLSKILLFVIAIGIHNLPEGIAAGVGFGSGDVSDAIMIAGGIALQNIPEGMVLIAPMLSAGITPKRSLLLASLTGVIEVIGTFLGYFAISIASALLPFILSYAGGCMLYVILGEMLPASRLGGNSRA